MNDDEKLLNEVLRDPYNSQGGRKPQPLTSSWCLNERTPPQPKPPQQLFFLDELGSNCTVARTHSLQDAYICMEKLKEEGIRTCIRPEIIDAESLQKDSSFKKWKSQMGYNPAKVR